MSVWHMFSTTRPCTSDSQRKISVNVTKSGTDGGNRSQRGVEARLRSLRSPQVSVQAHIEDLQLSPAYMIHHTINQNELTVPKQ